MGPDLARASSQPIPSWPLKGQTLAVRRNTPPGYPNGAVVVVPRPSDSSGQGYFRVRGVADQTRLAAILLPGHFLVTREMLGGYGRAGSGI